LYEIRHIGQNRDRQRASLHPRSSCLREVQGVDGRRRFLGVTMSLTDSEPQTERKDEALVTRSWLFAPGHSERLVRKALDAGADAVVLDLEDAVPNQLKERARELVAEVAASHPCWVRVNRPRTELCERDLIALAGRVGGFRIPKVESSADVDWLAERAPGIRLDCTIESARGVLAAFEIASNSNCNLVSYGGLDLALDLGISGGETEMLAARSLIVLATRASAKPAPSDGVYPFIRDRKGLRTAAEASKRLGFFGKAALHPDQIAVINECFTPDASDLVWAERVLEAFEASEGAATTLSDGQFVDAPVAERARRLLDAKSHSG